MGDRLPQPAEEVSGRRAREAVDRLEDRDSGHLCEAVALDRGDPFRLLCLSAADSILSRPRPFLEQGHHYAALLRAVHVFIEPHQGPCLAVVRLEGLLLAARSQLGRFGDALAVAIPSTAPKNGASVVVLEQPGADAGDLLEVAWPVGDAGPTRTRS